MKAVSHQDIYTWLDILYLDDDRISYYQYALYELRSNYTIILFPNSTISYTIINVQWENVMKYSLQGN